MNNTKLFSKSYWHRKYVRFLEKKGSDEFVWAQVKELYHSVTGKWLNWNDPKDINEKLMWLNRYAPNPLKTRCADKYLVREYVKEKGLEDLLIPLFGVWDNADAIDFESLPDRFVLKCNHGCGYNIICPNKSLLNVERTKKKLNDWLKNDYSSVFYEMHYKGIPKKVICEEFIKEFEKDEIVDYKFHCFKGKVHSCLVCYNRNNGLCLDAYSIDWERKDYVKERFHKHRKVIEKPVNLNYMLQVSAKLSEDFDYCRVDLYELNERVRFGELTFSPAANMMEYYNQSFLDELGNCLQLPPKCVV